MKVRAGIGPQPDRFTLAYDFFRFLYSPLIERNIARCTPTVAADRYHCKADHDLTGRCDTLIAVEQYAWRRSITLMAGAIGEALNAYGEIDRKVADWIFESPDSGAGSNRSTCHEFINLIHSIIGPGTSSPAEIKNLLWKLSILLVIMHAPVVEKIARALLATIEVRSDGIRLDLTSQQIEVLLGGRVPRDSPNKPPNVMKYA